MNKMESYSQLVEECFVTSLSNSVFEAQQKALKLAEKYNGRGVSIMRYWL